MEGPWPTRVMETSTLPWEHSRTHPPILPIFPSIHQPPIHPSIHSPTHSSLQSSFHLPIHPINISMERPQHMPGMVLGARMQRSVRHDACPLHSVLSQPGDSHINWQLPRRWGCVCVCVCVCVSLSVLSNSVTPWTVVHQAPLSMGFFRQKYWNGLPVPSRGDLPNPGSNPALPHCCCCCC